MRSIFGLLVASMLLGLVLSPSQADAQGRPVLVVPFERDNVDDIFYTTLMTRARDAASGSQEYIALDAVQSDLVELLFTVGCGEPTVECLQMVAESFNAEVILYGKVWGNDRGIFLEVQLFDAQLGESLLDDPIQRSFESQDNELLLKMAVGEIQQVFYPFTGEITIASTEPATEILLDGVEVGNTSNGPVKLTGRKLGEHTVTARKGAEENTQVVVVLHDAPLSLTLNPGSPSTGGSDDSEPFAHTGSLIAFGLGGASLVAGGIFSSIVNSQNEEVRDLAAQDPINASSANDLLDSGPTNELLQFVFYGVGAVAIGTGVVLYMMEGSEEAPSAGTTITPILTGDGVGAAIGGSF
jgi:hypothetical protein